jgi:iron-sulfur cluster assembly accessory protein
MRFPPFEVTPAAVNELARQGCVRLLLVASGCCGTAYAFSAESPGADDDVYGCDGARLAVSPAALAVLAGARLDYGAGLSPPRFRVLANPNTPVRCPCNRSFGEPWPGRRMPSCQSREPMPWSAG